jgi:hypothetical protein
MTLAKDNLRLHLTFFDELNQVRVMGSRNRFGLSLCNLGFVTTKESLQGVLETAGIDHYIICSGELSYGTFQAKYYELGPKDIVATLAKGFLKASELESKVFEGQELADEEKSFGVPNTLWLYSSSIESEDGLQRVNDWFQTAPPGARPSATGSGSRNAF